MPTDRAQHLDPAASVPPPPGQLATGGVVHEPALPDLDGGCTMPRMRSDRVLEILNASSAASRAQQEVARLIREEAYERGLAEGRRQATEGWRREWGASFNNGASTWVSTDEDAARQLAARYDSPTVTVVSRLVGPWEPTEQAEPVREGEALGVTDEQRNDLHKHFGDLQDLIGGLRQQRTEQTEATDDQR